MLKTAFASSLSPHEEAPGWVGTQREPGENVGKRLHCGFSGGKSRGRIRFKIGEFE